MSSRKEQKLQARADRLAQEAKLRAQRARKRTLVSAGGVVALVASLAGIGVAVSVSGQARASKASSAPVLRLSPLAQAGRLRPPGSPGSFGPEGAPIPTAPDLASTSAGATAGSVDGVQCLGAEQLLFHIHAHLTVYVNGSARRIPYGIGIPGAQVQQTPAGPYVGGGSCFYWLHSHAADGIIHIESPVQRTFTLGDFFDVWGQKLNSTRVGPAAGRVTAIYNGQLYRANPRDIPLTAHAQIQLDVGRPLVGPVRIAFPSGL
jgi:hypothetical protein